MHNFCHIIIFVATILRLHHLCGRGIQQMDRPTMVSKPTAVIVLMQFLLLLLLNVIEIA